MIDSLLTTVNSARILVLSLDERGLVTSAAGGDFEVLGVDRESIVGKPLHKIKNLPVTRSHFKTVKASKKSITVTVPIKNKIYESTLEPSLDSKGDIASVGVVAIDVTNRLELERRLDDDRFHATAAQRINSLAGMANGLAHEINNPLAIISGFSQQIEEMLEQDNLNKEEAKRIMGRIIGNCDRIHGIISNLQEFSRNAGEDPLKEEKVSELLQESYELCRGRFESKDVEMNLPEPDDILIECRAIQIKQVLFNVLVNAQEAASEVKDSWVRVDVRPRLPKRSCSCLYREHRGFQY